MSIVNNFLIDRGYFERIYVMKTNSIPVNLSKVSNWPELAAQVHYQAPMLAKYWNVSQRTLERQFRKQLNKTPQTNLDNIRQAEAEKLARDGMRTKEIAIKLDYKQASHFCRQFSAHHHGVGPRAWRAAA